MSIRKMKLKDYGITPGRAAELKEMVKDNHFTEHISLILFIVVFTYAEVSTFNVFSRHSNSFLNIKAGQQSAAPLIIPTILKHKHELLSASEDHYISESV